MKFKPLTLEEFDTASNHKYDCKCELCKRFWTELPPKEDDYWIYDDDEMSPF